MIINLFSLSCLLTGITSSILTIILLLFGNIKQEKLHRLWILFNVTIAMWSFGLFFISQSTTSLSALKWWKIAHIPGLFAAALFLHTICVFCEIKRKELLIFSYLYAILYILLDAFNLLNYKTELLFNSLYYLKPVGPQYIIASIIWLSIIAYALYELYEFYRRAQGQKRNQALYLLMGMLAGFSGGSTHFLTAIVFAFNIQIYPFGQLGVAFYCIIATYAILKYRLMDIRVFVSHAVAFLISYPLFLGVPFIFAYRMRPFLQLALGINWWWLAPAGFLLFFATLAPLAYDQIRRRMENTLLAEQKRYQKLLLQAASGMVTEHDLKKLAKLIVYIIKKVVKIKFAAIFLNDKQEGVHKLAAIRDSREPAYKSITFLEEHPFIDYLKKNQNPCLYEELPSPIRNSLGELSKASLIVPSVVEKDLLGFVLLGEKLNRQPYTKDDIDVFKTLANQAALAISYCLFLEEFKKAQDRVFQAEKLATIGGLVDGVTHQLRNRLNQFSVAGGEIYFEVKDIIKKEPKLIAKNPKLKVSLAYLLKGAKSIVDNVKRTAVMIDSIVNFAKIEEKDKLFSKCSLRELIEPGIEMLKVKHGVAELPLGLKIPKDDTIYVVKAQFRECPYNFVDNSYEAIQEKRDYYLNEQEKKDFKPFITLELIQNEDHSLIKISDNGIGMKKEVKKKIFSPLFTTKSSYKSGMGIGMYIVRRIIEENHKGQIRFESEYMKGTTFYIKLPRKRTTKKK